MPSILVAQGAIPSWRLSPELRISAASEGLNQLYAMVITPSGRMAVVDNGDFKLSIYDTTGRRIARAGGKGNGPGEFGLFRQDIGGVVGDSVWFYDDAGRRLVMYTAGGKHVRTTPTTVTTAGVSGTSDTLRGMLPLALFGDGTTIVRGSLAGQPRELMTGAKTSVGVLPRSGMVSRILARYDASSNIIYGATAKVQTALLIPFLFRSRIVASSDGAFVLLVTAANGGDRLDTVRITVIRPAGDTAYSVRQVLPRTRVPDSTYSRVRDATLSSARRDRIDASEQDRLIRKMHRSYPAVTRAFISRDGRTWLRLQPQTCEEYRSGECDGPSSYLVFSPAGKLEGTVPVPASLSLVDSFGGRAWGFQEDNDGFRNIVRFKIHR